MLGALKKLIRTQVAEAGRGGTNEETGTRRLLDVTVHQVRVFFGGGPYVVLNRRNDRVGDLLDIAADAIRAARRWTGADIVAVTVDVDPTETIRALKDQLGTRQKRGHVLDPGRHVAGEAQVDVVEDAGVMPAAEAVS